MKYTYRLGTNLGKGNLINSNVLSTTSIEIFHGGYAKCNYETSDINDFIEFFKNNVTEKLVLVDINENDLNLIINSLKQYIKELNLYYSVEKTNINLTSIGQIENLSILKINGIRLIVNLWDISLNKNLGVLSIIGVDKVRNIQGLTNSSIKELIIKNRDYNLSHTSYPIIDDFSVFRTMDNLEILNLFIGNKKNKVDDLKSLAKLKKIKEINLPKNYFFFNQFAWLSSNLDNVKGIGCIKEERWSKRIEKYVYTINGSRMAYEYKDYQGNGINKYLDKFNKLVEMYRNQQEPPLK